MGTMNHECYVSLEVAKLLKQAGFDWECKYSYFQDNSFDKSLAGICINSEPICYAPTLDVAQRWLREVKNCQVEIMYMFDNYGINIGKYVVIYTVQDRIHGSLADEESGQPFKLFEVYEKAQEAGIKKCLDVILGEKQ